MFGFSPVHSITPQALAQQLRAPGAQLLDVREPSEYRAGHIAGAKNVPLARIGSYTPPANAKLYVICRSGARSKRAYKQLQARGLDVTNVAGGMLAWQGRTIS
ncbi:rhodanese-like domain-containing protein [Lacticaseibacillus jixianensis]|uniref:Rhodanese-like domain-containing protein n=1 Tax=Lacticaseibacillus jixianensis TaxID=2486012 RepID=A0ABW4BA43_9LACO|nr:rhodanese-like domain-containing protein [Lacticaseibacillus jixianensis]